MCGDSHVLADAKALEQSGYKTSSTVSVETRYRYNPDIKSLPAMTPQYCLYYYC